jgi:hypothetical protein
LPEISSFLRIRFSVSSKENVFPSRYEDAHERSTSILSNSLMENVSRSICEWMVVISIRFFLSDGFRKLVLFGM